MTYQPPNDILEVLQRIEFEEALEPDDPRRVDTRAARGSEQTLKRLARKFGLMLEDGRFLPPTQKHVLFFGHVGAGKTTELKFYAGEMAKLGRIFPVEVDSAKLLDRNNLQYADLLMAMAHKLVERLNGVGVALTGGAVRDLENWFAEQVRSREELKEFTAEIGAGAEAESGLPFLGKLFAKFNTAFKTNSTYKEELRHVIRNAFAQFAEAFNRLIQQAEAGLRKHYGSDALRVLFVVDGTDKMRGEDTHRFFVDDAELMLTVNALAIYTAPISLKYQGGLVGKLDADVVLPMIKLNHRDGQPCPEGRKALRDILLKRADRALFESDAEIERLVETCGGHPRELLRLLQLCCEFADARIDAEVVGRAIAQLAAEYRRMLEPGDYPLLARVDGAEADTGNDDQVRRLLYNLALLEYNDGSWRRSHPVIRTLDGYRRALAAPAATP